MSAKPCYHFVGATLLDGRPVPPDGAWLEHTGPLTMCTSGLHASPTAWDALQYAPGPILCRVELDGERIDDIDKSVARRRRIVARIDATDLLRHFARACALDVIHLWEAPAVVRRYLETGDETLRDAAKAAARAAAWAAWDAARDAAWAAWDAARDAAWAAARDAAWAAAWDAAWDAARDAAWAAARDARDAAWAAARDAAWDAARDAAWAAWDAARDAAWAAQRERFTALVEQAFAGR